MYSQRPPLYAAAGAPMPTAQPDPSQQPMLPAPGQADPTAGGDPMLGEIQQGVQAFQQTRDPQVAMQVCDILAQMMGLSGGGDPAMQPQPSVPLGRQGMAMPVYAFKKGGRIPGQEEAKSTGSALEKWQKKTAAKK